MNLLDLPSCMLEQIFENLSYDEVAKHRLVSTDIDKICQSVLTRGFHKVCRLHVQHMRNIKSQLPRRESERRNHRLARHADILQCIETRISMLMMTYSKYIEANMCCFIPGRVIDEVLRLLRLVGNTSEQFRAREILQELRDITSMAIEHFDEKIAPELKKVYQDNAKFQLKGTPFALIINAIRSGSSVSLSDDSLLDASTSSSASIAAAATAAVTAPEDHLLDSSSASLAGLTSAHSDTAHSHHHSPDTHGFWVAKMNARIKREIKVVQMKHMKLIRAQNTQITELRLQVAELKRRVEETDAKNREIHLNVNQMSQQPTTVQATTGSAAEAAEPFLRKPNIKPRTAMIILKRRLEQFDKDKAEALAAAAAAATLVANTTAGGSVEGIEGEGAKDTLLGNKRPRRNK